MLLRIICSRMSASGSNRKVLVALGVLCACAAAGALLVSRRLSGQAAGNGGAAGGKDPRVGLGKMEPLLRRLPKTTGLLLATDNLRMLITDLRAGPGGKLLRTRSIAKFLRALRQDPPEGAGTIEESLKLALTVGWMCEAEAALLVWAVENDRGPAMGLVAHVGHDKTQECLRRVAGTLIPPGQISRQLKAGTGQQLHTLAPNGREGTSWGSAGEWVVVSSSIAGCRELLNLTEKPADSAPERLAAALKVTGEGRLVGFMEAKNVLPAVVAADLGIGEPEWFAYVAAPLAGGEWAERIVLHGKRTRTGIVGSLAPGGKRPMLASLPESSLLAISANVEDGVAFWRGVESISRSLGRHSDLIYVRRLAEIAADADFEKDLASQFKGELAVGVVVSRGAAYPQELIGLQLADGGKARLGPAIKRIMSIGGGTVESADYRGTRFSWLVNKRLDLPVMPSPAYCFKRDQLVLATASVHLKELIAGRGGSWLGKSEIARLSRGMLCARMSLKRVAPYAAGVAKTLRADQLVPEGARQALPPIEDVAGPLGHMELVLDRWSGGTQVELRSPVPVGAIIVAAMLAGE